MVDDYGQMENTPESPEGAALAPEAASAADSGSKRMFIIIGAVIALLVVAGLVAVSVFVFVLGGTGDAPAPPPVSTDAPVPAAPTAEGTPVEPRPVALNRVFTFRDIFDPLLVPLPPEEPEPSTSPGTTPSTNTTESPVPQGTLFLRDIVSQDGAPAAVLVLDGTTYTLEAGQSIPGTPWQVMSIGTTSVVMLYGDVQVTLSAGQGVTK